MVHNTLRQSLFGFIHFFFLFQFNSKSIKSHLNSQDIFLLDVSLLLSFCEDPEVMANQGVYFSLLQINFSGRKIIQFWVTEAAVRSGI